MGAADYRDYFQILGLERNATQNDIKKSFRQLARKYHPDLNQGEKSYEAKFKEISEAYEVLSDPLKRKRYEQFGYHWKRTGVNRSSTDADFGRYGNFEEFINDLLGRFSANQSSEAFLNNPYSTSVKLNAETKLEISLPEAFKGTMRILSVNNERVQIKIPKGIKSGSKLRVKGKGNLQPGTGKRGDLYINLDIKEHPIWKLDGNILRADLPIALDELVLGGIIATITPHGLTQLKIPKGSLPGQSFRLKGKGFPKNNTECGDLILTLILKLPDQWSPQELDLFNQLRKVREVDPRKDWLKSAEF